MKLNKIRAGHKNKTRSGVYHGRRYTEYYKEKIDTNQFSARVYPGTKMPLAGILGFVPDKRDIITIEDACLILEVKIGKSQMIAGPVTNAARPRNNPVIAANDSVVEVGNVPVDIVVHVEHPTGKWEWHRIYDDEIIIDDEDLAFQD